MEGIVIKSTGSWYTLRDDSQRLYQARIKGKFRMIGIKNTNPLAVGDRVDFEQQTDGAIVITRIHERKNYIIRKSVNLSKQTHIIASNIDCAFLLVTIKDPATSTGFIDRFLVTAQAYSIPVILLFNKVDLLYQQEEIEKKNRWLDIYRKIDYVCYEIVASQGVNNAVIKHEMQDKISLVSGHSGVGKTTLINLLAPDLNLKTQGVSQAHSKGQHTTTFAQMFPLPFGGYIVDTPGIKGLGLVDMEKEEIGDYFPEIFKYKKACKYSNCLHVDEPSCAVKTALGNNDIAWSRYDSYLSFVLDKDTKNHR